MKQMYRHGDLLLKPINALPKGLKKLDTKVLAYGEVTGHRHEFNSGLVQVYEKKNGDKVVQVEKDATLTHQEHKTITIAKGVYHLINEREYDPFQEEIQKVRD